MKAKSLLGFLVAVLFTGCAPKADLDKAQADLIASQEKVKSLEHELKTTQQKLQETEEHLRDAQKQLSGTRTALAQKSVVPVSVSFRRATMGSGYVAIINTSIKRNFPVLVRITSKALGTTREYRLDLSAQLPTEIGHAEGSPLEDGDVIEISNTDFEQLTLQFQERTQSARSFVGDRKALMRQAIVNNLRQITAAADQYFLEHGVKRVTVKELVGPAKYLKELKSFDGENYFDLVVLQGQSITVVTRSGVEVDYKP